VPLRIPRQSFSLKILLQHGAVGGQERLRPHGLAAGAGCGVAAGNGACGCFLQIVFHILSADGVTCAGAAQVVRLQGIRTAFAGVGGSGTERQWCDSRASPDTAFARPFAGRSFAFSLTGEEFVEFVLGIALTRAAAGLSCASGLLHVLFELVEITLTELFQL
jgi:hypothetical protein